MRGLFFVCYVLIVSTAQRHQGDECIINTRLISKFNFSTIHYEALALSSEGQRLAVARKVDKTIAIEIWNTVSLAMLTSRSISYQAVQFSPQLGYVWLETFYQSRIMDLQTGNYWLAPYGIQVVWSPDEKMLIINYDNIIEVFNSTSGAMLKNWTLPFIPIKLCWAASPWISVLGDGANFTGIIRYYSNGTLASMYRAQLQPPYGDLSCNSEGMVAFGQFHTNVGVVLLDMAGNKFFLPQLIPPQVFLGVNIVVVCTDTGCKLFDTQLQPLLALSGIQDHALVGLTPDESNLITYKMGTIYRWDVQTPPLRVFPHHGSQTMMWIDRDHFLNASEEFNVRDSHWRVAIPYPARFCAMQGMIYAKTGNSTIRVFLHGTEIRHWNLPSGWTFAQSSPITRFPICSGQGDQLGTHAFNPMGEFHWLVWNSDGLLLETVEMERTDWKWVRKIEFYNVSHCVILNESYIQFWDPQTLSWDPPSYTEVYNIQWSPNGAWLLILQSLGTKYYATILKSYQEVAWQIELSNELRTGDISSWSYDSNWIILAGSPPSLLCPKLKQTYRLDGVATQTVFWNPATMEIMSVDGLSKGDDNRWQLWIPRPLILGLAAANQTDVRSPATIVAIGANFLQPIVKTMLRWVDSSTNVPQCIFMSAAVVDAYTLSLGNIALPDPGVYTIHILSSSFQPNSPWLSSQSQFTTICGGMTRAAFSVTGDVTKCECFAIYYTVPADYGSEEKCKSCPEHGTCDGSTLVKSHEGYWPKTEDPYHFLSCVAGACPGENLCSPCYEGPRCGLCTWSVEAKCGQHGYGRCQECNAVWQDNLIIIVGLICWTTLCTIQSLFALGWRNNKRRGNNSAQLAAIIVSTTQVNALLLSVNVNLASFSYLLGFAEEKVPGGGVQSAVLSCILIHYGLSPSHVHFVKQVVMLVMPMAGWVVLLILRGCLRCWGTIPSPDAVKVPTVVLWSSLQSALTTSLFQTLSCNDVESQNFKQRLSHDMSVACFGNTYWQFIWIVTIPAIILTIIVIPLTIAWRLRYRALASQSGYLRFLVKSYRMDWWYLVIFYRKVLLSVVVTFTKSPFHVAVTLLFAAVIHIMIWPSTSFLVNVSEALSLMISAFVFGAVNMRRDDHLDGVTDLLLITVLSYCVQVGLLVYDRWWKTSENKDDMKSLQSEPDADSHYTRIG